MLFFTFCSIPCFFTHPLHVPSYIHRVEFFVVAAKTAALARAPGWLLSSGTWRSTYYRRHTGNSVRLGGLSKRRSRSSSEASFEAQSFK